MPAIAQVGFNDLLRDPAAPFIGAENADVTIIGFVDYNCPYCKKMQPEIDGLLKADPKVRVLYKDWPIFGDVSETAARTALAAGYQGKYEAVHNAFMLSPSRIGDQADITRLVQSAGVDMARLNQGPGRSPRRHRRGARPKRPRSGGPGPCRARPPLSSTAI